MKVLGLRRSAFVRAAPFALFMALLCLRQTAPADDRWGFDARWLYGLQTLLPAALLAFWWREYGELARQTAPNLRQALAAVLLGLGLFVLWIRLDAPWMTLQVDPKPAFVPRDAGGGLQWALVAVRTAGAVLLVPVMEELFWRAFLMRWVQDPVFERVPPAAVGLRAIIVSTFLFVLAHTLWLAAAIAGLAYALIYRRSGMLWMAVIAHAATNAALAVWVVATGNWQFW